LRVESEKKKAGTFFWILFCVFLGGVLWLANQPVLAFIVGGTVFGVAMFASRVEQIGASAREETEEVWETVVLKLLSGESESECTVRALIGGENAVTPYREFMDPGRILQKSTQAAPVTGFENLFCAYFLLKRFPCGDLNRFEEMMEREARRWQRTWWQKWKKTWWSQIPVYLRKPLEGKFAGEEEMPWKKS